jgi:NADPH-dependent curcumin reductase
MPVLNRQVRLKSRPEGIPQAADFELVEEPLGPLAEGRFRVRNRFLSVDPAMRGWVSAVANYSKPVGIGEVMRSFAAGEVMESRHPDYAPGERVMGMFGWQDYADTDGRNVIRKVREDDLPLSLSLGVLGLYGITAYCGLTEIGQPRPGETVVASTAAGSVGATVGQVARLLGCRAVGIGGGRRRCGCASTNSATTPPSTTRPSPICAAPSPPPAHGASMCISTTPPVRSVTPSSPTSPTARGW